MGLTEKLRERAQELATEAKKATSQAQGKLEEVTLRRRMDDAARQLGYLVYRERTQGTPAGSDADALVNRMRETDDALARHADQERGASGEESSGGAPAASSEQGPMEKTQPGAAPAQSPPEGSPTDQPRS
ncbi:MAG TPA: hypothetical protein VHK89_02395 [Actinomycetota bacterium]|nr:hypothetical protein [Actinomycetota bacterium]